MKLLPMGMVALCCVAQPLAWGPAVNGLRLGVGVDSMRHPVQLRVVYENVGTGPLDLLLGGMTGIGPMYHNQFRGTAPDGAEVEVLYLGGAGFVAGMLTPIVERLAPGAAYTLPLPLTKFVYVKNRKDITLDELLRGGYSIRGSMDVSQESARWGRRDRPLAFAWIGKVTSGDYRLPGQRLQ